MEYDEPKMNRKEKKKLALAEVALIILAVIGLAVIVWIGWLKPSYHSKATVNSFSECAAAGNPIQTTYPEVCVTAEGRRFTAPH